ncbi:MAG: indole-3-glycerol phosphate synthase TrpC [Gemmataceae bacterium]
MGDILDDIVATKWREVEAARARVPLAALERGLADLPAPQDFRAALDQPGTVQIIAEVKKASPSAGIIRADFDPVAIARTYAGHGAAAISVLTDAPYFQGSLEYLQAIRAAVDRPLLRKDFIVDRYQLVEARRAGADAVLLIAEILDDQTLPRLLKETHELGMQALVELFETDNLPRVIDSGARVIGINNRNLRTFVTRLEHTIELAARVPADRVLVGESGIKTHDDLARLQQAGVKAVLVGESLMRAPDIGAALDALLG